MLIASITRTTVAFLCVVVNYACAIMSDSIPPPKLPTAPWRDWVSTFSHFLATCTPKHPEARLIYIYWSIKSAKHELLWQPRYLNKRNPLFLHRTWVYISCCTMQTFKFRPLVCTLNFRKLRNINWFWVSGEYGESSGSGESGGFGESGDSDEPVDLKKR